MSIILLNIIAASLFNICVNNEAAIIFSKIIIYLGNEYNIKKLYRYEYNINTIIHKEEFSLKQKCFNFLKNQRNIIENQLNNEAEKFKQSVIIYNDKKNFIMQLEEDIIRSYKTKFFKEKIFFIRSKYYISSKKEWKKKSPIYGPNKNLVKNFHNIKLKKKCLKVLKKTTKKIKQMIEKLQIKNFMKNVKFFFYQSRKKTIESLIIEGIRQKIDKYNKLLFMKILLYSKIECLKQYRVMISTRKKYQKKLAFNLLKKNVLLHNSEVLCNIKFYFNFCFKIKIKMIKKRKSMNEDMIKQGMQKYFFSLVQIRIKQKKQLLLKKEELKNNLIKLRKRNFIKSIKNKTLKKKYDNLIYLKHDKIFSFAIGIINLKIKCNVELKLKSKFLKKKNIKQYFNIFKKRAIISNKNNKKFCSINIIKRKLYYKKYLEAINICYKMKNIDKRVDEYYITKRKKNFFNILKKRYQDSIKFSMLSLRFNEYLIISSFNCFIGIISKNQKKNQENNNNNY